MLSSEVLAVLRDATVNHESVILPPEQLDRKLYEEVNQVLVNLGGKWHKTQKRHYFYYDPTIAINTVLETGITPPKNPHAYFPTPKQVVAWMIEQSSIYYADRILEPSAGTGAIADAIREKQPNAELVCIEFNPINAAILRKKGHIVVEGDFLEYRSDDLFDAVVMNPPFSYDKHPLAYVEHIMHAWSMLKDNHVLTAIVPPGWKHASTKQLLEFQKFVYTHGSSESLGAGAFRESGTTIETLLLSLEKTENYWKFKPHNSNHSWMSWATQLWIDNDYEINKRYNEIADLLLSDPVNAEITLREFIQGVVKTANREHDDGIYLRDSDWKELLEDAYEQAKDNVPKEVEVEPSIEAAAD